MKKIHLVTGATGGIGKAICEEIAKNEKHEAEIIIHYNSNHKAAQSLQQTLLKTYGTNSHLFKADFGKEKDVEKFANDVLSKFKQVDVLINVAGIVMDKDISERTYGDFEKTFRVNVFATFLLTKLVGLEMLENKSGKIVNISSVSATEFYPTSIDYNASKASINTMTKDFAIAFAPHVNVNAVSPGMVDTPLNETLPRDVAEIITSKILKSRWAKPCEIAGLVYFLTTPKADFINGSILVADGGKF